MNTLANRVRRLREVGLRRVPARALRWLRWKAGPARRRARALAAHVAPPVCRDIRSWCSEHPDSSYRILAEAHRISRPRPHTVEPTVHPVFEPYYEVEAPCE